jgi:hypothetical protein
MFTGLAMFEKPLQIGFNSCMFVRPDVDQMTMDALNRFIINLIVSFHLSLDHNTLFYAFSSLIT